MISDNKLFTWVDVQDSIMVHLMANGNEISDINFRVYWDGLNIIFSEPTTYESLDKLLENIFLSRFEKEASLLEERFILLEGNRKLPIHIQKVPKDEIDFSHFKPSISRPSFIGPLEKKNMEKRSSTEFPAIYAFHSFKGGVGRTLHAISMAINLAEKQKVLLIDADFEAPGISWLVNTPVSFADLLTLIHGNDSHNNTIDLIVENLKGDLKENENLFILPAFRSPNLSAPILEIKPEHIFRFNDNPFILTDILIELAKKLKIDYILIDLRAGVSELSTGWFFDPRINKVFVTTLSSQSILGTSMMFRLLSKFEVKNNLRNAESSIPSIIISQIPKSSIVEMETNWNDIYASGGALAPLRSAYKEAFINIDEYKNIEAFKDLTEEQIIGRILDPQTLFSEEYDSLKSLPETWEGVVKLIKSNELHKKLSKISDVVSSQNTNLDLLQLRSRLRDSANKLVFAETEHQEGFLQTEPIKNLINTFNAQLPIAVIVGAKGSGKTFLYKQVSYFKDWQYFGEKVTPQFHNQGTILPITLPANLQSIADFSLIPEEVIKITVPQKKNNIWQEYIKPDIELSLNQNLTVSQWREKWFDYIAWAAGFQIQEPNVGRDFIALLKSTQTRVIASFDGLEDLFKQFNNNDHQQKALESLLQDVPTWLESQSERFLGILVFVRRDIVTAAIQQNSKQFLKKYEPFELKWNVEEALRLVHWVMNRYVVLENPTFQNWEATIGDKSEAELIKPLYVLWGMRMAKDTSKEAYSHNWILGSLANLKKEIQSRDIIRFLETAAKKTIEASPQIANNYDDRILIPTAIRDSIDEVGRSKIDEVKIENEPLNGILESLQKTKTLKFPCQQEEIIEIIQDKGIRILEDNGVIVMHNGEYYMAELYRKGMGFEYSRKGRPKVLYF